MTGRVWRGLGVGALIGALWLGTVAAPASAANTVRWVNDGGSSGPAACATAPFSSIQDAIDASSSYDTVYVCPGHYQEQIVIDKTGLLVQSRPRHRAHIVAPDVMTDYNGEYAVAVLEAWGARLKGFDIGIPTGESIILPPIASVAPQDEICTHVNAAVLAVDGHQRVNRNVIHPIGPNSLSGECGFDYGIVFGTHFLEPTVSGAGGTILEGSEVSTAAHNKIKDFHAGGILIEGPQTKVHAHHNKIRFLHTDDPTCSYPPFLAPSSVGPAACPPDAPQISLSGSLQQLIANSKPQISPSQLNSAFFMTFGIGVEDGAAADITYSNIHSGLSLFGSGNSVLAIGIWLINADGTSRARQNVVTNTGVGVATGPFDVNRASGSGISPSLTTPGVAITRNQLYSNVGGIVLTEDEGHVTKNIATANLYVGMEADSMGNLIHGNNFAFNLIGDDCYDDTAVNLEDILNTWYNNLGVYSTPEGLCTDPTQL